MAMRLADFYPVREDSMRYMRYMETKFQKKHFWSADLQIGESGPWTAGRCPKFFAP